jgi:hypothetical protein
MTRSVRAGGVYFAAVFALGFALGIVRVLITAPAVGESAAVLLEIPILLLPVSSRRIGVLLCSACREAEQNA